MLRLFILTIFINALALGVILEEPRRINLETTLNSNDFSALVDENLRIGESPGLFFLHLLKNKLNKIQQLEKFLTTNAPLPNCICVPYYQCDKNNNIILDGFTIIEIRYRHCTGDQEVCCYLRIQLTTQPVPTTTTTRPTTATTRPTTATTRPTTTTTRPTTTTQLTTMSTTRPTTQSTTTPTTTTRPTMPSTTTPVTAPTYPTACYCVYFWQCDTNGYIVVDNSGIINPRQNTAICPLPNQICCRINPFYQQPLPPVITVFPPIVTQVPIITTYPSIDPRPFTFAPNILPSLPSAFTTIPTLPTLPTFLPGQTCMCILNVQCSIVGFIPVSTGGKIDPRYTIGALQQIGSSCSSSQETCCRIIFSTPPVQQSNSNFESQEVKYPGTSNACICVKRWTCPEDRIVYPDRFDTIDIRLTVCSIEDEVCCRLNVISQSPGFSPATTTSTIRTTTSSIFSEGVCGFISKTFAPDQRFTESFGRTYFAEFPWMVALLLRQPGQNDAFLCGASMINSMTVLTAGHCVDNRDINYLIARFGEWDTSTTSEPLPFQEARIEIVIMHPKFYSAALYHDVAILILKSSITYSLNVMPICLPEQGQVFASGTRCYATGWGSNAFGAEGKYQTVLKKIDLPLITNADCQSRLRQTRLGQYFQLHGSFVCAGGEESRDTCQGDGGGPLICPNSGQYVQVGIVSWGIGCGSSYPAVYTNVAQHRLWIDEHLSKYGVL